MEKRESVQRSTKPATLELGFDPYLFYNNRYKQPSRAPVHSYTGYGKTLQNNILLSTKSKETRKCDNKNSLPVVISTLSSHDQLQNHHGQNSKCSSPTYMLDAGFTDTRAPVLAYDSLEGWETREKTTVVDLSGNRDNRINRNIHECMSCPLLLYTLCVCCLPALWCFMKSDEAFADGKSSTARKYGRISTVMYAVGFVLSLLLFAAMFFVAIYVSLDLNW